MHAICMQWRQTITDKGVLLVQVVNEPIVELYPVLRTGACIRRASAVKKVFTYWRSFPYTQMIIEYCNIT